MVSDQVQAAFCFAVCIVLLACAALLADSKKMQFLLLILAMGAINASVEQIEGLPVGLNICYRGTVTLRTRLGTLGDGPSATRIGSSQIVPWLGIDAVSHFRGASGRNRKPGPMDPVAAALLLTAVSIQIPPSLAK